MKLIMTFVIFMLFVFNTNSSNNVKIIDSKTKEELVGVRVYNQDSIFFTDWNGNVRIDGTDTKYKISFISYEEIDIDSDTLKDNDTLSINPL